MKRSMWILGVALVVGGGTFVAIASAVQENVAIRKVTADPAARAKARVEHRARLVKALAATPTSLVKAIQVAEAATGGKAIEAEVELEKDGTLEIEVVVLVGDKMLEVEIDPTTGKVLKTENDEDDDD